jgi:hypothetical protein
VQPPSVTLSLYDNNQILYQREILPGFPILSAMPRQIDFGLVVKGKSKTERLLIGNAGIKPLDFDIASSNEAIFSANPSSGKGIQPGKPANAIAVSVHTTTTTPEGNTSGKLTIYYDPAQPPLSIELLAKVIPDAPIIELDIDKLDFGLVYRNKELSKFLHIRNKGPQPLTFDISSGNSQFSVSESHGEILPFGEKPITVTFRPTESPPFLGSVIITSSLKITHNDPARKELILGLSGATANDLSWMWNYVLIPIIVIPPIWWAIRRILEIVNQGQINR